MGIAEWRWIESPPFTGAWNMALDEAILDTTAQGINPPTLRLYSWDPGCLSLGYAQPYSDVNPETLKQYRWDLVRRPTGGRAILHIDELTYSVCGPQDDPVLTGGVLESYRRLAQALLMVLHALGLPAEAHETYIHNENQSKSEPVCFEVPSNYEITVNGKKLLGSAQARRNGGVLQHGSLPLFGDINRINQVLKYPDQAAQLAATNRLRDRACTVQDILGRTICWEEAAGAFIQGFQEALGIHLTHAEPTQQELERAKDLAQNKYATPSWNCRI